MTATPGPPAQGTHADLTERLDRAVGRLEELAAETRSPSERLRLNGKVEGVKLAAAYLREQPAEDTHTRRVGAECRCGAEWEPLRNRCSGVRSEDTPADVTDARVLAALNAMHPKAAAPSLDYWGAKADEMRTALRAAGLLATAPTRPTKEN